MKKLAALLVTSLGLLTASHALADGHLNSATSLSPVLYFDGSDSGGESRLTRTATMILLLLEAEGLVPGDAYTVWFIVFNNPEGCSDPCNEDDFTFQGILDAQIAVGNATGNVAKANGTAEFGGRLVQGEVNDHQVLFGAGIFSPFLLTADPHDAEVHLIVQSHGQARGGKKLLEQLTYVDTNCTPTCADVQFAVHLP